MPSIRADKFDKAFLLTFARAIEVDAVTVGMLLDQVKVPPAPAKDPYKEEMKKVRKEISGLVEAMKAVVHHLEPILTAYKYPKPVKYLSGLGHQWLRGRT